MTYAEQLKHPMWQKKRLEVLEYYNFTCKECHVSDQELHVHHPIYRKGMKVWEYDTTELFCLCKSCHEKTHRLDLLLSERLALLDINDKRKLLGYLDASQGPMWFPECGEYVEGYVEAACQNKTFITNILISRFTKG